MKEVNQTKIMKRDPLPDIIRGFAILLVIWGHCIQEGNGAAFSNQMQYFDDRLYQLIYSFHMPLFALVAGYFAYPSIKKATDSSSRKRLLFHRVSVYIIPIFVWTLLEYIRECIVNTYYGYKEITITGIFPEFAMKLITNHWFLWSMIICFVIVYVMHYFLHDNIFIFCLGLLSLFFIPDGLNMHAYKFLMPFYFLAFYFHMNIKENNDSVLCKLTQKITSLFSSKRLLSFIILLVVFIGLFMFYDKRAFIYVSGYRITKNIWYHMLIIDVYRFVIGLIGSLMIISFWSLIASKIKNYSFPILRAFGTYSLGVYLLSGYITILGMRRITDSLNYSIIRVIAESVIVAIISLLITIVISKIPIIKKIVGK